MIAAVSKNQVIGANGTLPWHFKKDFAWFVERTKGKVVVMGRKNYEDIVRINKGKPLKNRINVVVTSQEMTKEGFVFCHSIEEVMERFKEDEIMVIGGEQIYKEFLPYATELILTEINRNYEGNVYFPAWDHTKFKQIFCSHEIENSIEFKFCIYQLK